MQVARCALIAQLEFVIVSGLTDLLIFLRDRLVDRGIIPASLLKAINRAMEVRNVADYKDEEVVLGDARQTVEDAEHFVATIQAACWPVNNGGGKDSGGGR